MQQVVLLLICLALALASPRLPPKFGQKLKVEKVSAPGKHVPVPIKDIKGRVIGGRPASNGQFPWQAALDILASDGYYFCGGSLITEQWILSAAHCVVDALGINVSLGNVELDAAEVFSAISAVYNADYDPEDVANDVSAIQLSSPVPLSSNIQVIARGTSVLGTGVQVTLSGFGITHDGDTDVSPVLNYASLTTISDSSCSNYYRGALPAGIVCANGDNGESSCSGDSGGPLITGSGQSAVQVGIVSFGSSAGCEVGAPQGYTRVAYFADWIQYVLDNYS